MANYSLLVGNTLKFTILLVLFAVTFAQPKIPNAFSAQVTTYSEGYQVTSDVFVNYDYDMVLVVSNLGVLSSAAGRSYTYFTGNSDMYRYLETFDSCTATYTPYPMFPNLNMLGNATYQRTHSFMGQQVDVWQYDAGSYGIKVEIGFLSMDDDTPVYLLLNHEYYQTSIIISSFSSTPPSYSRFDLPDKCSMAKKTKLKVGKAKGKAHFEGQNIFKKHMF